MKKILIIISICLLACSCGSKKTKTKNNTNEDKIDLQLGTEDMVFIEDSLVCGNYNVQSKVTFNQDGTASYEFYDCQENNIILESSEGTYSSDDLEVTLTNNYEEKLEFEISDNNTILLKDGNKTLRTFTK